MPNNCKYTNIKNIAILSDTHGCTNSVRDAANIIKKLKPDLIIHAGDMINAESLKPLINLNVPIIAVFGNCDKNREKFKSSVPNNFKIFDWFAQFTVNDKNFFLIHDLDMQNPDTLNPKPDIIIHGHSHFPDIAKTEKYVVINPGEATQIYTNQASMVIMDITSLEAHIINI